MNKEANWLIIELTKLFIKEAIEQCKEQARLENDVQLKVKHLEKIAARFLLDF